jgi:hypothetical protein
MSEFLDPRVDAPEHNQEANVTQDNDSDEPKPSQGNAGGDRDGIDRGRGKMNVLARSRRLFVLILRLGNDRS